MNSNTCFGCALILVVLLSGCSINGHYTSNPKSKGAFAGYEIILSRDKTFEINSWTDNYSIQLDADGNRIWSDPHYKGSGTYNRSGDYLELTYLTEDSIAVHITRSIDKASDSYYVSITDEPGNTYAPIVSLKNSQGITIHTVMDRGESHTTLGDSLLANVHSIGFDLHQLMCPAIIIPLDTLREGINTFKYKTYNGYYPKDSSQTLYCKKAWSGIRYGPKKRWLAKKRKWQWLNRFYED